MYLSSTLIIASLSLFVQATPTSRSGFAIPLTRDSQLRDANGVVNMARLHRSVSHSIRKIHHGFHAYRKNTGSVHPSDNLKQSEKRSTGNVPLSNMGGYGSISVGGKTFKVSFDTGSADLFIPSSSCGSSCNGHTLYNPSDSGTSHNLWKEFYLGFADGSQANGTLYTDDVTIAGYTAKNQIFGAVTSYSDAFAYPGRQQDGVLGLGFPSLSSFNVTPPFHTLVAEHVLPTNSFGLSPSELYIGGTNNNLFKGTFTYVPLTHQAYWQTQIDGLYLNKDRIAGTTKLDVIIDTGTSMIVGDKKTLQAFYSQIPGSYVIAPGAYEYFNVPCSFDGVVSFKLGGVHFTMSRDTFNFGTYSADPNACVGAFVAVGSTNFWVLGDAFLKNVYTEFDVDNTQLGFATLA